LALYRSLKEHCPEFRLWILCMDNSVYTALSNMGLPDMELIKLDDFEKGDDDLRRAKQNRSRTEYYFTCTPSWSLYILNNFSEVNMITYVDADLYFYADPEQIFHEIGDHSIAIIEHCYARQYKKMEICGKYNVGWISFRRDENGLACLRWWRDRCNEWCYKRFEDGKFADQKYLDDWPTRFNRVIVIQHKGANLASWNIENYKVNQDNGKTWIDEQCLIFFHFHRFKRLTKTIYGIGYHQTKANKLIRKHIYKKYLRTYLSICNDLRVDKLGNATPNYGTVRVIICGYFSALYRVFVSGNYIRVKQPKTIT
jgi:hypothetical protein